MSSVSKGVPPSVDEEEREDPKVQLVVHIRYILDNAGELLESAVVSCNGLTVVGNGYDRFVSDAYVYIKNLVCMLVGKRVTDSEVCAFVMEALSSRVHGFFGHALRSLCSSDVFYASKPTGMQDAAVWMLLKATMSIKETHAREAVHILMERSPDTMAACGFLALLVRSPAASGFLTEGICEDTGLSIVFDAMCYCTDPYKNRTAMDIVLCTQSGSCEFSNSGVAKQFQTLAHAWLDKRGWGSSNQRFVGQSDADTRSHSIHRLQRCEMRMQTTEWSNMVAEVSARMASEKGLSKEQAAIWNSVWTNCHHVLCMSRRIVSRRGCASAMVVWTYSESKLYAFARRVRTPPGSIEKWAVQTSDAFEREAESAFVNASVVPSMPTTRLQKKKALAMPGEHSRWECLPVDEKTKELLEMLRTTHQSEHLCVGQGAFRNGTAFAVVSYRHTV